MTIVRGQDIPENGLELWLKADSGIVISDAGFVWNDLRDNGNYFFQDNLSMQPDTQSSFVLNNRKAVLFDGSNDFLTSSFALTAGTIIIVTNYNSETFTPFSGLLSGTGSGPSNLILVGGNGGTAFYTSAFASNNMQINGEFSTNFAVLPDYKVIQSTVPAPLNYNGIYIGRDRESTNRFWNGDIAEVIIYDHQLSTEELAQIREYLYNYYGNKVNLASAVTVDNFCSIEIGPDRSFKTYEWSTGSTDSSIVISESGDYILNAVNEFGISSSDTISVSFPGNFLSSFTLCAGSDSLWDTGISNPAFTYEWNDGSTDPDYLISEAGEYSVTIYDDAGCSFTSETVIADVDEFPNTLALPPNPQLCLGNTLALSSGADEAVTYSWNTGNNEAEIIPESSGTYWLEAENALGCIGRDTVEVDIIGIAPEVEFSMEGYCQGEEIIFTDITQASGGAITGQSWEIDGVELSGEQLSFVFEEAGLFGIGLTVSQDNGCNGFTTEIIEIKALPEVNFTSPLVCSGMEVIFEDIGSIDGGSIVESLWTFGNGSTDSGILGSTVFEESGMNTVQLVNISDAGCSDTLLRNVIVYGSPVADFTYNPTCIGEATLFEEDVDTSESGPVFWNWQFGDGFFSNFQSTTHTYAQPGEYEVTLLATSTALGGNGCQASISKTITVHEPPIAQMDIDAACLNTEAVFTDLTEQNSGDPIIERSWLVAGNEAGSDSVQSFSLNEAGLFNVDLLLSSFSGCEAFASAELEIFPLPLAAFELDVPLQAPPLSIFPENLSENASSYIWDFGNGESSTDFEPEIIFSDTGSYTIQLQAFNEQGCQSSFSENVFIFNPYYNIAILNMSYRLINSRLQIEAELANYGNVDVNNFQIQVELGTEVHISEEAYFSIPAGETGIYTLNPDFYFNPDRNEPFACLFISQPNGHADEDMSDNSLCIGLTNNKAYFLPPYPNPATDRISMGLISPQAGTVEILFFDATGKLSAEFLESVPKGYSRINKDISFLNNGLYVVRVMIGEEEFTTKVVVSGL